MLRRTTTTEETLSIGKNFKQKGERRRTVRGRAMQVEKDSGRQRTTGRGRGVAADGLESAHEIISNGDKHEGEE